MLKWISFILYGLACLFYVFILKDISIDTALSYGAVRDALIFNVVVALGLSFLLEYCWKNCNEGEIKPHVHCSSWFFYISILLGVWIINILPTYLSVKDGVLQSATGITEIYLLSAFQSSALIFGVALIAVEFFLYHRKK